MFRRVFPLGFTANFRNYLKQIILTVSAHLSISKIGIVPSCVNKWGFNADFY